MEFDSSCKSVFLALYHRATVCLIPPKLFLFPKRVIDLINEYHANILIWSTFAFRILANFKAFRYSEIPSVKKVENIPGNAISYWMQYVDAEYYNLYAPTEYSFNCLFHKISGDEVSNIPLGRELVGSRVRIINPEERRICKPDEEGEIYIQGLGLSMGYYQDAKRTSDCFVQNPLHNNYPDIVYKTGDYGLRSKDGFFYFKGRIDNQIKHQGYRIELGEIESVANAIRDVHISAAVYDTAGQTIQLFYEGEAEEKQLYHELKMKLPSHLLPKLVVRLEKMPLNQNNKVDRRALKIDDRR